LAFYVACHQTCLNSPIEWLPMWLLHHKIEKKIAKKIGKKKVEFATFKLKSSSFFEKNNFSFQSILSPNLIKQIDKQINKKTPNKGTKKEKKKRKDWSPNKKTTHPKAQNTQWLNALMDGCSPVWLHEKIEQENTEPDEAGHHIPTTCTYWHVQFGFLWIWGAVLASLPNWILIGLSTW
jgi:hypothetical protein